MSSEHNTNESIEYQIGAHEVDASEVNFGGEESDFTEFKLEARTVFKRLAKDIYKSDKAGIRETLINGITACVKASEDFDVSEDEIHVQIQLIQNSNGNMLVIQDNGIGISETKLKKVVSYIGRSTVRDRGDLAGQFGMGFLAAWRLVGTSGGFVMYSHSREEGEEPISGVWKSGGFARDTAGALPNPLDDDEYGTRFEFMLDEEIDAKDIRSWVEEYSEWARCPVIYQEFNDTRQTWNEDYGCKSFKDDYEKPHLSVTVENEYFTAVRGSEASGETILLDVPIERNKYDRKTWKTDIRLHNESGVIVSGPHKGLMVAEDAEYGEMTADRQDKYVPKSQLTERDVQLPQPIGTRDTLSESPEFWAWLEAQTDERIRKEVKTLFEKLSEFSDIKKLPQKEFEFLEGVIGETKLNNVSREPTISERIVDITGTSHSEELLEAFELMSKYETLKKEGDSVRARIGQIYGITLRKNNFGNIYMAVVPNADKMDVLWNDSKTNYVLRLKNANKYDDLSRVFGWDKLASVKKSTLSEFDVSDSVKEKLSSGGASGTPKNVENRQLTIHVSNSRRRTKKFTAGEIKERFEDADSPNPGRLNSLILFPTHMDEKVSNNYKYARSHTGVASCSKKVWEYLKDVDGINTLEESVEIAESHEFETQDGTYTLSTIPKDTVVLFHTLEDAHVPIFKQPSIFKEMPKYLRKHLSRKLDNYPDNILYAPVTGTDIQTIHPALTNYEVVVVSGTHNSNVRAHRISSRYSGRVTKAYMWCRLPNWRDTIEMNVLSNCAGRANFDKGGYELIETFAIGHDAGEMPPSAN